MTAETDLSYAAQIIKPISEALSRWWKGDSDHTENNGVVDIPSPAKLVAELTEQVEAITPAVMAAADTATAQAGIATAQAGIAATAASNAQAVSRTATTWAQLSGWTPTQIGEATEVLDSDAGTHTDPSTSATVANAGRYQAYATTAGAWTRISSTGLAGKASASALADETATRAADDLLRAQIADFARIEAGLYGFPNNTVTKPVPGSTVTYAIDPTAYAASTNLSGANTSTGSLPITVRFGTGTSGVFSVSGDATAADRTMRASAGTLSPVLATVDTGVVDGMSQVVMASIDAYGGTQGIGPICGGYFNGGAISYFRVSISTAGLYILQSQKTTSGGYAALTTTLLATSSVYANAGDVVACHLNSDGVVRTYCNSVEIASYQMTEAEMASSSFPFASRTHAGIWSAPAAVNAKAGAWTWGPAASVDTVTKTVAVGPDYALPEGVRQRIRPAVFDIRDSGAKCDGILITDAAITAGSNVLSSPSHAFAQADVGKRVGIKGAGVISSDYTAVANDGVFVATIRSVALGNAVLTINAVNSVSAARCIFGTLDDAAIANAQQKAAAVGGTVFFPPAHTIVAAALKVKNYVSWAGAGREISWVHVVKVTSGGTGSADWLTCSGRSSANPLIGATFSDFAVNGEFMAHTGAYTTSLKPLNIYHVQRCAIERMYLRYTPATAIPFDHGYDQVTIRDNYIYVPGRLAAPGAGPGGSGIGIGVAGDGAIHPTLVESNVIIGTHSSAAVGAGYNGIFIEAQTGSDASLGNPGHRVIGNVVIGMPYGVTEAGASASTFIGNYALGCGRGFRIGSTSISGSFPGRDSIWQANVSDGATGPGDTDGVGLTIYTSTSVQDSPEVHAILDGFQITRSKSWGVSVNSPSATRKLRGIRLSNSKIRRNGRSGVRLVTTGGGVLEMCAIYHNDISENGQRGIAGDTYGVLAEPGTQWIGGRLQDNEIYDLQSSPTQTERYVLNGATTDVRIDGNTGDA